MIRIFIVAALIAMPLVGCSYTPQCDAYTKTNCTPAPPPTPAEIQAKVVDTCQGSAKKQLKDPDSAQFSQWTAWPVTGTPPSVLSYNPSAGDKYYSSGGMVNAKNGFGGYHGDEAYACDAVVTTTGDVTALANSLNLGDG